MHFVGRRCSSSLVVRGLAGIVFFLFFFAACARGQSTPPPDPEVAGKNILLLYSYGHGGKGITLFDDGLLGALSDGGIHTNHLYFEYLDLERNQSVPQYAARLHEMLKNKYAARQIDLIVTVQQPARNWLLSDGRDIAAQAPAIAVQAPMPSVAEVGSRHVISVLTKFDIQGTMQQALQMLPDTKRVLLVAGSSDADRKLARQAGD